MLITIECAGCLEPFEHDAQGGFRPLRCPPCRAEWKRLKDREKARRWRALNPERAKVHEQKSNAKRAKDPDALRRKRENELRRLYGLTPEDYRALVEEQQGRCAICRGAHRGPGLQLHVDHCHDSKRVRGLLCSKCNTAIGLLDDDPARADAVAKYLRR